MVIFFFLQKKCFLYCADKATMKWSSIACDISFELAERKKRHTAKVEGCRKVFKSTKIFVKFKWNGECDTTMMREKKNYSYVQKALIICILFLNSIKMQVKFDPIIAISRNINMNSIYIPMVHN